jgi:hypothetical protein
MRPVLESRSAKTSCSRWVLSLCFFTLFAFFGFPNIIGESKNKNTKTKIAHPKEGGSGRELGLVIFFLVSWLKTKENKKQKTQKQDCTPQAGGSGKELGLVIFFCFLFFFVFFVSCFF